LGLIIDIVALNVEAADVLPEASSAVQETVVWSSGNVSPDAGVQVTTGAGSTLS